MFAGIPLENTPDFEYIFADTVRLPEFELYHIGLGIYRLEQPLNYSKEEFKQLTEKYSCLTFFFRRGGNNEIILLFVMSAVHNITNFGYLSNALRCNKEFAKIFPKEYDACIDGQSYNRIGSANRYESDYDSVDIPNRLLGFRWLPEQYYDLYGRRRYIMINSRVAKLIATGLYVFQGIQSNDVFKKMGGYPLIQGKIISKEFHKCAVIGERAWNEQIDAYWGIHARYIAFDDIGINLLKRLYEYTVGYEYRNVKVIEKEEEPIDIFDEINFIDDVRSDLQEREQKTEEKKNAYQIGANAVELIKGIGYRDIAVYSRVLFHIEKKAFRHPKKYDFVYIEDGMLKLVDISKRDTKVYKILISVLAELSVVKETEICFGVKEEILFKVIDNTHIEKNALGAGNYDSFTEFVENCER